jgi:hypothetical protein
MRCPRPLEPPIDEDYSPFWTTAFIHSSVIEFADHIEIQSSALGHVSAIVIT